MPMPVMCSCTNELRLATAVRTSLNDSLIFSLNTYVPKNMNGKMDRLTRVSRQSV